MPDHRPLRPEDPSMLGEYRLVARLGEGGQGVVYLADDASGAPVAVKVLHPGHAADEQVRRRFAREAALARRVAPFCTARVLDSGAQDGRLYLVSEYIEGASLHRRVVDRGPLADDALYRVAVGTAAALAAIHRAGVVHRDFKPSNVLLGPDGPRVVDFGIARALDASTTLNSGVIGTPAYMSPEQVSGATVTAASDVFSWAVTVAFAATGRSLFGQDGIPAVLNRIAHHHPDLSAVPGSLRPLIGRCLAKQPQQRPDAVQVLLALLGDEASSTPTAAAAREGDAIGGLLRRGADAATVTVHGRTTLPDPDQPPARTPARISARPPARTAAPTRAPISVPPAGRPRRRSIAAPVVGMVVLAALAIAVAAAAPWPFGGIGGRTGGGTDGRGAGVVPTAESGRPGPVDLQCDDPPSFGCQLGEPITRAGRVNAVALGELDGEPIVLAGRTDGTLRAWSLTTRRALNQPLTTDVEEVNSVAITELRGIPVAVSGGSNRYYNGSVQAWDLITGEPVGEGTRVNVGRDVYSMVVTEWHDTTVAVVASSYTSRVRVFELTTGVELAESRPHSPSLAARVATVGELDGTPVAVWGSPDGIIRVGDLLTGEPLAEPIECGCRSVTSLAVTELDGRLVAVTGGGDQSVRVWDLAEGRQLGNPLTWHTDAVTAVAVGEVDGTPVAVSSSRDRTIRVYELAANGNWQLGEALTGHGDRVMAVAIGEVGGTPVVVSGGYDDTVRVWSLAGPLPSRRAE